jgi:hypothetical protein
MFPLRYFCSRFFPERFWPKGQTTEEAVVGPGGGYFAGRYFCARYFAKRYFPTPGVAETPTTGFNPAWVLGGDY